LTDPESTFYGTEIAAEFLARKRQQSNHWLLFMKRFRIVSLVVLAATVVGVGMVLFFPFRPAATVIWKSYETNYAKVQFANFVLTNQSNKTLSLVFYIATGEGSPMFVYKTRQNGKWSKKQEGERPRGASMVSLTLVDVEPGTSLPLKIALPDSPGPFEIGFKLQRPWAYEVSRVQQWILRVQQRLRLLLRLPPPNFEELWCPTALKAE
jgi:hypothetical protein